jgi:hypothetical protein
MAASAGAGAMFPTMQMQTNKQNVGGSSVLRGLSTKKRMLDTQVNGNSLVDERACYKPKERVSHYSLNHPLEGGVIPIA